MLNFKFHNPTKVYFGKGALENLSLELKNVGNSVLVVSGGSSVKRIGLYDNTMEILKANGKTVYTLEGVQPNPRLSLVREGVKICKENNVGFILAIGGGSVIDTSKSIAVGAKSEHDIWDFFLQKQRVSDALPVGTILTLAATGSEMNGNAVVTNWETNEKVGLGSPYMFPRFSILDPEYTYSVPKEHTAYGSVDIMAHVFEQYFSHTENTPLQDGFSETILRTVIQNAPIAVNEPNNYDARANLMWSGTMALNTLIGMGKIQDWASHSIEHAISAIYDIAHGAGLAIIFPHWMKYVFKENIQKFKQYAINVWNISEQGKSDEEIALAGIEKTKEFFKSIGAPTSLKDANIDDKNIEVMAQKAVMFGPIGQFKKLNKDDVAQILKMSL